MSVLLLERVNHKFQLMTKSKQKSGLSICLGMISKSVPGVHRVYVENLEHVELAIQRFNPKKIVFEALWASQHDISTLKAKYPRIKIYLHLHSNIPFLACEGYAMAKILESQRLGVGIICNDSRAAASLGGICLPNIYHTKTEAPERQSNEDLNVIIAGSMRPMKNHLIQAIAAIRYAESIDKKLRLHVNMGRSEGGGEVAANFKYLFMMHYGHELISIPWMDHGDFIRFLSTMDIGLQVSMSESFNIVAADYAYAHLPMVVSSEVRWAADECKADPGCSDDIMEKMAQSSDWTLKNLDGLEAHNFEAKKLWGQFVAS